MAGSTSWIFALVLAAAIVGSAYASQAERSSIQAKVNTDAASKVKVHARTHAHARAHAHARSKSKVHAHMKVHSKSKSRSKHTAKFIEPRKFSMPTLFVWKDVEEMCKNQGFQMCTYEEMCPEGSGKAAAIGSVDKDRWTAIADAPNEWVETGNKHKPCMKHTDLGFDPWWGKNRFKASWKPAEAWCCQIAEAEVDSQIASSSHGTNSRGDIFQAVYNAELNRKMVTIPHEHSFNMFNDDFWCTISTKPTDLSSGLSAIPFWINKEMVKGDTKGFSLGFGGPNNKVVKFKIGDGKNVVQGEFPAAPTNVGQPYARRFEVVKNGFDPEMNDRTITYYLGDEKVGEVTVAVPGDIYSGGGMRFGLEDGNKFVGTLQQITCNSIVKPQPDPLDEADGLWGPGGEQGETGAPGKNGGPGTPGANGLDGRNGMPGEDGTKGLRGPQGLKGSNGKPGPVGPRGPPGKPGSVGNKGVVGTDGDEGGQGPPGAAGQKGTQGIAGAKGQKGGFGPKGEQGDQGRRGERGDQGEGGIKGLVGDVGEKGQTGEKGPDVKYDEGRVKVQNNLRPRVHALMESTKKLESLLGIVTNKDRWTRITERPGASIMAWSLKQAEKGNSLAGLKFQDEQARVDAYKNPASKGGNLGALFGNGNALSFQQSKGPNWGEAGFGKDDGTPKAYSEGIVPLKAVLPVKVGMMKMEEEKKEEDAEKNCPCWPDPPPGCPCGPSTALWFYRESPEDPKMKPYQLGKTSAGPRE